MNGLRLCVSPLLHLPPPPFQMKPRNLVINPKLMVGIWGIMISAGRDTFCGQSGFTLRIVFMD